MDWRSYRLVVGEKSESAVEGKLQSANISAKTQVEDENCRRRASRDPNELEICGTNLNHTNEKFQTSNNLFNIQKTWPFSKILVSV